MINKNFIILFFLSIIFIDLNAFEGEFESDNSTDRFDNIFGDDEPILRKLTHYDALSILTAVKVPSALYKDIYSQTYPLAERSIFFLPSMLLYHSEHLPCLDCFPNLWRLNFFFNQTKKLPFGNSHHICEYLSFDKNPIFELDENALEQIKFNSFLGALDVIKHGKVSERRTGFYMQYLHSFDCRVSLEVDVPFYYLERNYYLDDDEIRNLEMNLHKAGIPQQPACNKKHQERLMAKYAVSDKVGFGDTTIRVGWLVNPCFDCAPLKIGLLLRLPTDATVKEEVIGTYFKRDIADPHLDIYRLMCLAQQDPEAGGNLKEATKIARKLLLKVSNRLSSILLDRPLGADHFGIGAFADNYIMFNDNTCFRWAFNSEYLIPSKELRFFCIKKNKADFEIERFEELISKYDPDELDPVLKKEISKTFDFLNTYALGTLMPKAICTRISPGFIFQITAGPQINYCEWQLNFGYDFWYQQKETIQYLYVENPEIYDITKGTRPNSYQFKFFAELRKTFKDSNYCASFGLHGEEAILTKGIGRDFNVALDFQILF